MDQLVPGVSEHRMLHQAQHTRWRHSQSHDHAGGGCPRVTRAWMPITAPLCVPPCLPACADLTRARPPCVAIRAQVVDSENLVSLFVIVSKHSVKEWEGCYETLSSYVVSVQAMARAGS